MKPTAYHRPSLSSLPLSLSLLLYLSPPPPFPHPFSPFLNPSATLCTHPSYGIDSCMSLYCENCEMGGSCDAACGLCTPTCGSDADADDANADASTDTATATPAGIDPGMPSSVSSMGCGEQQAVSTDDTTDFMITPSGSHGVQVVSVQVCAVEDASASDLEVKLYNGCPNQLCRAKHARWAYSESAYTGETLSAEGGCTHMTLELDAEADEGVYLALSAGDNSRDVTVDVSCSATDAVGDVKAMAPSAAPTGRMSVAVRAENSYSASADIGKDYPWNADGSTMVVEPHRATQFYAELSRDTSADGLIFRWEFDGATYDTTSQHVE